jgi:C4-dicarboxylate-specific signal transduction histidine kinase
VLLNLARNAIEACADVRDAHVVIRGEVVCGADTGFQRISISDNGPGIAGDALPNLFHPFFTTKPQGTGLGLAVVQKIVVQHGGQVEARNQATGGAVFIVSLPAWQGDSPEALDLKKDAIQA